MIRCMAKDHYNAADENWDVLKGFFPDDWRQLARETGALKGLRKDKSPDNLLRTILLHVGCGHSMRETVTRAREAGLADLSDVAFLKRLRKCEEWLYRLAAGLWEQRDLRKPETEGRVVRLVDATVVKEPGKTGSQWRIHYSLRLPSLRCDCFKLTPTEGKGSGEGLWQFAAQPGDCLIGDRGYSNARGIVPLVARGVFVLIRFNHGSLGVFDAEGRDLGLLDKLKRLDKEGEVGSWNAFVRHRDQRAEVRVCALRKSRTAIEKRPAGHSSARRPEGAKPCGPKPSSTQNTSWSQRICRRRSSPPRKSWNGSGCAGRSNWSSSASSRSRNSATFRNTATPVPRPGCTESWRWPC